MPKRHVDNDRDLPLQGNGNQPLQLHRIVRSHADCTERLSELDEVGIVQVGLIGSAKRVV